METIRKRLSSMFPGHSWELVSERSVRSIYRLVRRGEVEYYVKIYSPRTFAEKLRNILYPRTLHEARMLARLRNSGLPAPAVNNHVRAGSESALVTRAVFPAKALYEEKREKQIEVMLNMSVRLLNEGYCFTDMHAGNIILDCNGNPFLVDAYEISPFRIMTSGHAASLLAQVASVFDIPAEKLDPYLAQIRGIGDIGALRDKVRSRSRTLGRERVRRRVRRSLRDGSFSRAVFSPRFRAFVNREHSPDLDEVIACHLAQVSQGVHLYKFQEKTQLSRVGGYCVKSYRKARPPAEPYAVRSWKGSLTLLFNDIPVADPVAVIIFPDRGSMLVTRALDQPDLDRLLSSSGYRHMSLTRKRELAASLGALIGTLHKKGVYHADLKACNIKADADTIRFFLLDTDRVEQMRSIPEAKRLRNLVQLNTSIPLHVSRTMRMAFLKAYCSLTGEDPKDMFRRVWRLSRSGDVIYCTGERDRIERWPARRDSA